jgi:M6 family metalloprotease-like protein
MGRSSKIGQAALLLTAAVSVSFALAWPASAGAISPYGTQQLLVVPLERQHVGCPTGPVFSCPRNTAAQWQKILDSSLNTFYRTETYGQTGWAVHVVADPNTADGWWPAPHTQAQYSGNNNFTDSPSPARDAAETVISEALADGALSFGQLAITHRLLVIDNYHARGGQTDGAGTPVQYNPVVGHVAGIPGLFPFVTTVSLAPDDSNDADAISVFEHELGHQLGLVDLYSLSPCPLTPAGAPIDRHTQADADCVGPWDHMALDFQAPGVGFGGYSKQQLQWLDPNPLGPAVQDVASTFNGLIALDPIEQPAGGKLIIQIPDDPGGVALAALFGVVGPYKGFMVECRRRLGDDGSIPAEGVLVSYVDPTRDDHPQDVARGSASQTASTAILSNVGDTYSNSSYRITISNAGTAAHDGCLVAINRRVVLVPHYVTTFSLAVSLRLALDASGAGKSFSAFAGAGVMVNGPILTGLRAASRVAATRRPVRVTAIARGRLATIRFAYANAGGATARGGIAAVRVTDPYAVSVCGPPPKGRLVARVRLRKLPAGAIATARVRFRPRSSGPIGVSVHIRASGSGPAQAGETEQGVLGFQTSHRGKKGRARATTTRFIVSSSRRCSGAARVYLNSLVLPRGWKITGGGLGRPVLPGQHRMVRVTMLPPPNAKPQALDLPIEISAATEHPALAGEAPPDRDDQASPLAGLDLFTRVVVAGKPTPHFVLPGRPPPAPVVPYPRPLPPRTSSVLTINCPSGASTGIVIKTSGSLSPAQAGATVTLTDASVHDFAPAVTHTASTDINGDFSDTFTPPVADEFTLQAAWTGDGAHLPTTSGACRFGIG